MSQSAADPLPGAESGSQAHYFQSGENRDPLIRNTIFNIPILHSRFSTRPELWLQSAASVKYEARADSSEQDPSAARRCPRVCVGNADARAGKPLPRKLPKRKSRFKRSDGSTSSDTTSSFIKRQVSQLILC
ncbi:hypothetical protein MHYP_G00074390 [Metynnis hypsauchen]